MKKHLKRTILASMTSGLLLASGMAQAQTVNEQEVNNPVFSAQELKIPNGKVVVSGVLGRLSGTAIDDTDYYYFHAQEGDVVTIDIDGAWGGARSFDSFIAVFESAPGLPIKAWNDDTKTLDEGSTSIRDSRIDNFRIEKTGNYIVGVSNYKRYFQDGGTVANPTYIQNGDYTLTISGVSPEVQQISIEIKPGSTDLAPINPKSKGKIPVALLSSKEFNALNANPAMLTFGATGNEASLSHCGASGEDVNGDGLLDLVCHFENQTAGFEKGDLEGILRGRTSTGRAFEGRGRLKVIPEKRGS